ncbi:hypothetical protein BOX15_Mlig017717g9 [Macrostomum lignano]|nr:hypothetical protein BOX15_Mlig017717g9 [Macrostomum lignano]
MRHLAAAFALLAVSLCSAVALPVALAPFLSKAAIMTVARDAAINSVVSSLVDKVLNGGGGGGGGAGGGGGNLITSLVNLRKQNEETLNEMMKSVGTAPNPLITQESMNKMVKDWSLQPQKAGTRSISLQADQGFNGLGNYQPPGWVMTETLSGPANKIPQMTDEKVPVYQYPKGVGPMLMNGCTGQFYSKSSPCNSSKLAAQGHAVCPNLLEAAAYVGVGFDGRGFYKIESRRASLVQRYCSNKASFQNKDVPDSMNVFGIFETTAETKSFQSGGEYMNYIREKAGLSKQRNLFRSEASKHSTSVSATISAFSISSASSATGYGESSSVKSGESVSENVQTESSNMRQGASNTFFAIMYVSVIMYEITLDDVKPQDINLAALKDYMSLPESYYSVGADVKYQNFLLRWGTHFIRSGKFGGQLKITKTAKMNKVKSVAEFASIAETEFQSMFASLQSRHLQTTSKVSTPFYGGQIKSEHQSSSAKSGNSRVSTMNQKNQLSQSSSQSEFTQTSVEAQGGTPEIAEALVDFYTPSFKSLYHKWIVSISDYVKPFEFQLKPIDQLFNMNMDDLFLSGNFDFGCMGGAGSSNKVKILVEPGTNRRYHLDEQTEFRDNRTETRLVKTYCKYRDLNEFKTDLDRRTISLEKAVAVYMAEGPFPTSTYELEAGQSGCEEKTLAQIDTLDSKSKPLTFLQLKTAPFLISFDLPEEIPNLLQRQAKYAVVYRGDRWFATEPGSHLAHLYDGCQLGNYKLEERKSKPKICIWNIILTYENNTGFFYIDHNDFSASKRRNPLIPGWMSGLTVARASSLSISKDPASTPESVPCNVKWLNSHRLDPSKNESCLHFTAATEGDIFVIFASIPRDQSTWYYLQINAEGVLFYKAMKLKKRDENRGMGTLGDRNLYQSYFVCVLQSSGSVLMQFGKADATSEVGTVYSGYKFPQDSQYSRLSFYTFGAGSRPVSLMDIRLTKQMPKVRCLNNNYKQVDGHCVLDCHAECIDCTLANDDISCFQCRNVRIVTKSYTGDSVVKCLPVCPRGFQLSDRAEKLCVPCSSGSFKNSTGNQNCTPCDPGTFTESEAQTECKKCSPGTFTANWRSQTCKKCAEGTSAASKGSVLCRPCSPGSFAQVGQAQCTPCPLGQFNSVDGQSRCQLCSVGYFAATPGLTSCDPCPNGTNSTAGSASCENHCRRGEFSPSKGIPCRKCSAGTFAASMGAMNCTLCPAGTFGARDGQSACTEAPAGSYVPLAGSTSSTPCPMGTFNPETGKSSPSDCLACAAGSFSNRTGSAACVPCPKGSYQPLTSQSECRIASPGRFVDSEGQLKQKFCPSAHYSGVGASKCCAWSDQSVSLGLHIVGDELTDASAAGRLSQVSECKCNPLFTIKSGVNKCNPCPESGAVFTGLCFRRLTFACGTNASDCTNAVDGSMVTSASVTDDPNPSDSHLQFNFSSAVEIKGFIVWFQNEQEAKSLSRIEISVYGTEPDGNAFRKTCYNYNILYFDGMHLHAHITCATSNVRFFRISPQNGGSTKAIKFAEVAVYGV